MAIFYNKVQRVNPSDRKAPAKWYPVLRTLGMVKEKEVARQVSDETTLNPKEAEMALSQIQKIVIRTLLSGHSIQLGDWGSLYLTLSSSGSETEEEVTAANIKKINIRFTAGKELKDAIARAEVRQASSLITVPKENEETTTP